MSNLNLASRRILVVDDENFVRSLIVRMLQDLGGPKIEIAENGDDAITILAEARSTFDLVLLDFNMPKTNGLVVLKAIRTGKRGIRRDLPVAMLTGNSDADLVHKALDLDVNAFLVKPTSRATLASRIERMLGEEPHLRDVAEYEAVELPATGPATVDELEGQRPATVLAPRRPTLAVPSARGGMGEGKPRLGPRVRRKITEIPPGAILADDVKGHHDVCLLRSGITLTGRFIHRLQDVAEIEKIDHVWIYQVVE